MYNKSTPILNISYSEQQESQAINLMNDFLKLIRQRGFSSKGEYDLIVLEYKTITISFSIREHRNRIPTTEGPLNSKSNNDWKTENPTHSNKLTKNQNIAGTLGHEFMHTLDTKSSSTLSPKSSEREIERRPRQFSEMFYFQILNKK